MDKTWEVPGGFLAFSARFARTGIQMYDGSEIDPDREHTLQDGSPRFKTGTLYPVNRPAKEVFSPRAMASFVGKPLTNDHPRDGVTIDNHKELSGGVAVEVLRDGQYARLSGLMTDKALIADYKSGKKELSGGYGAQIVVGDGVNEAGEPFVAQQTMIDGNHVAFVNRGRAGSECRVTDAAPCAALPVSAIPTNLFDSLTTQEKPVKTMLIDGLTVDIANADTAMATIQTILSARDAANGKVVTLEAQTVSDAATIVAKDAEIAKLTADLAAARPTLQQLRDAGKAFAVIEGKAKALGIAVTDAMDETAIMKAVVDKAMPGNAYAGDHIKIAFDALTKDTKIEVNNLDHAIGQQPVNFGDAEAAYEAAQTKRKQELRDGWKTPFNAADAA